MSNDFLKINRAKTTSKFDINKPEAFLPNNVGSYTTTLTLSTRTSTNGGCVLLSGNASTINIGANTTNLNLQSTFVSLHYKIVVMDTVVENILPIGTRGIAELGVAKPKWLKVKLPIGQKYTELRGLVDKYNLNTISIFTK